MDRRTFLAAAVGVLIVASQTAVYAGSPTTSPPPRHPSDCSGRRRVAVAAWTAPRTSASPGTATSGWPTMATTASRSSRPAGRSWSTGAHPARRTGSSPCSQPRYQQDHGLCEESALVCGKPGRVFLARPPHHARRGTMDAVLCPIPRGADANLAERACRTPSRASCWGRRHLCQHLLPGQHHPAASWPWPRAAGSSSSRRTAST